MTEIVTPEMLWESADPDRELRARFGFGSVGGAYAWAAGVLEVDFGAQPRRLDRVVLSHDNLMVWVTAEPAQQLIVKVCRRVEQHDRLAACGGLVRWLSERGVPVAAPLLAGDESQIVRDGRSIGVQPVLAGELLDARDPGQVQAAGVLLADLHDHLAQWPDRARLEGAGHRSPPFTVTDRLVEAAPPELLEILRARSADLPTLPVQVVHADFRASNLLVQDGQVTGILDFEEAYVGHSVVDLAQSICLLGTWFHDWAPVLAETQEDFLRAYTSRRPLTDDERRWLAPLVGWIMLSLGWFDQARRWLA